MRTSFITDKNVIQSIINQCDVCFVGMVELDGTPYVIPMNFGYTTDEIILHSAPEGKHIQLLEKNNRICVTFCTNRELVYQHPDIACSYSMLSKSVLCKGSVSYVEDLDEKESCLNILMKNYTDRPVKYSKPALMNVKVWRVKVDEITSKAFGQNFKTKSDL
jgi:nitroimidazol reductase NimA-like FMN-containing flavoprotein (pyridoxamine 5'-phosphate oxidase superfamily)